MNPQKPINVDVTQLEIQICPKCECPYCHEVFRLRHLPALMSPDGKAQLLKVPAGFACANCGGSMFEVSESSKENADAPEEKKPLIDLVN